MYSSASVFVVFVVWVFCMYLFVVVVVVVWIFSCLFADEPADELLYLFV